MSFCTEIEGEFKSLCVWTFDCMRDCFRRNNSIPVCSKCADSCESSLKHVSAEVQQNMQFIQNSFQNCMQGCGLKAGKQDANDLMECVAECSEATVYKFQEAKENVKELIKKYL